MHPPRTAGRPQEGKRGVGILDFPEADPALAPRASGAVLHLLRGPVGGAEGLELVEVLLQRAVPHPAGQVVALLALRPGAPDGGALPLAVDALEPVAPPDLRPDVLPEKAPQPLVLLPALVQPGGEEQAEVVRPETRGTLQQLHLHLRDGVGQGRGGGGGGRVGAQPAGGGALGRRGLSRRRRRRRRRGGVVAPAPPLPLPAWPPPPPPPPPGSPRCWRRRGKVGLSSVAVPGRVDVLVFAARGRHFGLFPTRKKPPQIGLLDAFFVFFDFFFC